MNFEITALYVEIGLMATVLLTVALIYLVRFYFERKSKINLSKLHEHTVWSSPLEGRSKYPELDVFRLSGTFLNYGLLVSLILMIFAFSWTTYEAKSDYSDLIGAVTDEIEMETPRTAEPPPPPPPPPPTAIQLVPTDMPIAETVTFKDQSIEESTAIEATVMPEKKEAAAAPPPPPPPPPPDPKEREIFKIVEENPAFPGCESISQKEKRVTCAEEKMLRFIYENIQYPAIARENGVSGLVVLSFVVEKDGSISNINILRDIGAGCGDEASRVVSLMPKWNPGKQRGRPVRVQFTLPVRFKLEGV